MTEPFDANAFQVSDVPSEHVTPNHRVKPPPEAESKPLFGKLRQPRGAAKSTAPVLPKPKKEAPPYREGMYIEPMRDFYEFMGMVLLPFRPKAAMYLTMPETMRDSDTGEFIEGKTGAQKCAEAWDAAAKKSPAVRRMLESFLMVSVWGTLVAVHIPLLIALTDKGGKDGEGNMFAGMEAFLKQQAERDAQ
ncbi:MAG TPA: hypothetical protein VM656_08345 [Pyrinomonadaceae bacterium]|nr:hypothetical protein [Pyrinomonadaceae bacterium]